MRSSPGLAVMAAAVFAAAGSAVAQEDEYYYSYTATATASVYAAQATAKTASPVSHVPGKAFDRLAIIWLENTDYDLALSDPNLAWLATQGITLENYFAQTHPSEPNYVASHGGDYFGMNNDDFNFIDANISTITDLLEDKGIAWAEYQEDMPYTGFEGHAWVNQQTGANDYVRKHNPAVIYNKNAEKADRLAVMKNLTLFYEDLENETLPQWMFITPNMTSDGHDSSVTTAGAWTRNFLEPLLNDTRFMNRTLVLVTFDENASYAAQNRVLALLLGDAVPAALVNTTDANFYNHYSEIATVEANWDLHTLGRWDVGANVFAWVADEADEAVRAWDEATLAARFFNESYDGVFHDDAAFPVYPAPNLTATSGGGGGGRTVLPAIQAEWADSASPCYYAAVLEVNDGLTPPAGYGDI